MNTTYSLALQGVRNAERMLEGAARNIATGPRSVTPFPPEAGDRLELSSEIPTHVPDLAREMLTIIEARIGLKANLRVAATQHELDRSTLDIFG